MTIQYEEYEWLQGDGTWLGVETFINHTAPASLDIPNADWGDTTETYGLSIAVEDSGGERSGYTAEITLNPMEWLQEDGTWLSMAETLIPHTVDDIDLDSTKFVLDGLYEMSVLVEDSGGLQSGYSNERSLVIIAPYEILSPSAIPSGESFGNHAIVRGTVQLSPSSIPSGESLGAPVVAPGARILVPPSIPSEESFGTPWIVGANTIMPVGITSGESIGTPYILFEQFLFPAGVSSGESFGTHLIVPGEVSVFPVGISSEEAFGVPEIYSYIVVLPFGIPSEESFGTLEVIPGTVIIIPVGIGSEESFGNAYVVWPGIPWIPLDQTSPLSLLLVKPYYMEVLQTHGTMELVPTGGYIEVREGH